jgi:hypothetical protein
MAIVPLFKGGQNKDPKTFIIEFKIIYIFETISAQTQKNECNFFLKIVEGEIINMIKGLLVEQKRTCESLFKLFVQFYFFTY